MNHSYKTAFCGIMTAMALVSMFLGQIVPVAIYTCTLLSGICIAFVAEEINIKYASSVYFAASVLAMLFLPDKEVAVNFIVVFGFYPIYLKIITNSSIGLVKNGFILFLLKLLYINCTCIIYFYITIKILCVPKESFSIGKLYLPGVFLIMGNIICFMFEQVLNNILYLYKNRYRKIIIK